MCTLFFRCHGWYDLSCSRRMESYPIGRDQTDQVCRQCSRWNPRVNSTQPGTRHYNGCLRWCFHTVLVGIVRTASWHRHRGRIALARTGSTPSVVYVEHKPPRNQCTKWNHLDTPLLSYNNMPHSDFPSKPSIVASTPAVHAVVWGCWGRSSQDIQILLDMPCILPQCKSHRYKMTLETDRPPQECFYCRGSCCLHISNSFLADRRTRVVRSVLDIV